MRKLFLIFVLLALGVIGSLFLEPSNPLYAPSRRLSGDTVGSFKFTVEVNGVRLAHFKTVTGLSTEVEVIEKVNSKGTKLFKEPGKASCGNVTLKKGMASTKALWYWWESIKKGKIDARTMKIKLHDKAGKVTRSWVMLKSWPRKWSFSDIDVASNEEYFDEIEFVVEELILE